MPESGSVQSTPSPVGQISCESGGCINPVVDYTGASVIDPLLAAELASGIIGQKVSYDLVGMGTTAINVRKTP